MVASLSQEQLRRGKRACNLHTDLENATQCLVPAAGIPTHRTPDPTPVNSCSIGCGNDSLNTSVGFQGFGTITFRCLEAPIGFVQHRPPGAPSRYNIPMDTSPFS